jgi:hypothetical protein
MSGVKIFPKELERLREGGAPMNTDLNVHGTGRYSLLPACIEDFRAPPLPPPAVRAANLRLMDHILRCVLLEVRSSSPHIICMATLQAVLGKQYESSQTLQDAVT